MTQQTNAPEYMAPKEVAAMIGISTRTLWRWIALGRLTPYRMSRGTLRFRRQQVVRAVEKSRGYEWKPKDDPSMG